LLFLLLTAIIGVGVLLGWKSLAPRMEMFHEGYKARAGLNVTGRYMAQDNPWFGTGPGTYSTMFQLYRHAETDDWLAFLHNDWLETLIDFGRIGFAAILGTLLLIFTRYFFPGGIPGNKYFVMLLWVSLAGCLFHAYFDFPFQIHSILTLFLVLCAVLSCLSRRRTVGS